MRPPDAPPRKPPEKRNGRGISRRDRQERREEKRRRENGDGIRTDTDVAPLPTPLAHIGIRSDCEGSVSDGCGDLGGGARRSELPGLGGKEREGPEVKRWVKRTWHQTCASSHRVPRVLRFDVGDGGTGRTRAAFREVLERGGAMGACLEREGRGSRDREEAKRSPDEADLKRHGQALALAAFVAMASSDRVEESAALEYALVVGILAFVGATVLGFAYLCGYSEHVRTCQCFQKQGENIYYILMLLLSIVAFLCGIFTSELDAAAEFSTVMILFLCGAYGLSIALTIKERRDYESSMGHLASQGAPMPA